MSFVDKISCGAVIVGIQEFMPSDMTNCTGDCAGYFAHILVYGCGTAAIFGIIIAAILSPMKIGQR